MTANQPSVGVDLSTLMADTALRMHAVVLDPAHPVRVNYVAVSELADPTPFLEGGELLLLSGVSLPEDLDEYVERVQRAGVAVIGLGLGPVHSTVPVALSDVCARRGLPLVSLDAGVPFTRVSRALEKEQASRQDRQARKLGYIARQLTREALRPGAARGLVTELARLTGRTVLLRRGLQVEVGGRLPAGTTAQELVDSIAAASPNLDPGLPERHVLVGRRACVVRSVQPHFARSPRTALIAMIGDPDLTSSDWEAFALVADLLQLVLGQSEPATIALDQLILSTLLDGPPAEAARKDRLVRLALGGVARGLRVVIAVPAHGVAAEDDLSWWREIMRTPLVDHRGATLRAVIPTAPTEATLADLEERGWLIAVSSPHQLSDLRRARNEAELLVPYLRETGRHQVRGDELIHLGAIIPGSIAEHFAAEVLHDLEQIEDAEEIIATLEVWLTELGGWEATARRRGLHRNTVHRQVRRAAEVLGRDLDDAHVRADVLFALVRRHGEPGRS